MNRAAEFLARYGEKGYIVLRAILEAAREALARPGLGDFDYRGVRKALERMGYSYNPSPLLGILEREYGLIETSYKSSNQHWWRFLDRESIEEAVREYEGRPEPDEADPRLRLLRIQFYSLDPGGIMDLLQRLSARKRLTSHERNLLRRIAFDDLPHLVDFLEAAKAEYPDELADEIAYAEAILELAEALVGGGQRRGAISGSPLKLAPRSRVREPF